MEWGTRNLEADIVSRRSRTPSLLVRHEDFTRKPQETVERILDVVGESESPAAFLTADAVDLGPNHTCGGNRLRLGSGAVQIKQDLTWLSVVPPIHLQAVSCLTLPMLRRYRYPFRVA